MKQEQQVKELSEEIAEATAKGAYTSKELAQHLISKGWRKAGELTVISDEELRKVIPVGYHYLLDYKIEIQEILTAQRDHDREA